MSKQQEPMTASEVIRRMKDFEKRHSPAMEKLTGEIIDQFINNLAKELGIDLSRAKKEDDDEAKP